MAFNYHNMVRFLDGQDHHVPTATATSIKGAALKYAYTFERLTKQVDGYVTIRCHRHLNYPQPDTKTPQQITQGNRNGTLYWVSPNGWAIVKWDDNGSTTDVPLQALTLTEG